MFNNVFFFFRKLCFYEIMWKKHCKAGQATDGACALHEGYLRQQTHAPSV